jgi:hypothetical protein
MTFSFLAQRTNVRSASDQKTTALQLICRRTAGRLGSLRGLVCVVLGLVVAVRCFVAKQVDQTPGRAAAYIRESTEEQRQDFSPGAQCEAIVHGR